MSRPGAGQREAPSDLSASDPRAFLRPLQLSLSRSVSRPLASSNSSLASVLRRVLPPAHRLAAWAHHPCSPPGRWRHHTFWVSESRPLLVHQPGALRPSASSSPRLSVLRSCVAYPDALSCLQVLTLALARCQILPVDSPALGIAPSCRLPLAALRCCVPNLSGHRGA